MLTCNAIGGIFKKGASISAAEVGCQGEVGVATAMAAAGLCQVLGGDVHQVEMAAESGMEHNLGLTCDPIGGLVQVPCIERNAMGAVQAWNAAKLALLSGGDLSSRTHVIRDEEQDDLDVVADGIGNTKVAGSVESLIAQATGLTSAESDALAESGSGANKAVSAVQKSARLGYYVSLDAVVAAMKETGAEMSTRFKETSLGGLALHAAPPPAARELPPSSKSQKQIGTGKEDAAKKKKAAGDSVAVGVDASDVSVQVLLKEALLKKQLVGEGKRKERQIGAKDKALMKNQPVC